jgi:glycosyltransferase involved in cell wall biosynthesis
MRLGFDTSPLNQTMAGTARYIQCLDVFDDVEFVGFGLIGTDRVSTVYRDAWWYPVVLPRMARREGVDVLHCPTFRGPLSPPPMPLVVTVHDLAVLRHPETFNSWTRHYSRLCVPRVARAASQIIAVSEFTKHELGELIGTPAEKVTVIPNGVAEVFSPDGPAADGDYVLTVGTLEPRKNLGRVQEAVSLAGAELRVVGGRGWGDVHVAAGLFGRVTDDELARLYRGAKCVVYASLYEGFGLPIAEAMACGTPVVTSRGGATEETAGGAAVLVDPYDPAAIATGIADAVARHDELRRLGLERARAFSWDEAARATLDVYREVVG